MTKTNDFICWPGLCGSWTITGSSVAISKKERIHRRTGEWRDSNLRTNDPYVGRAWWVMKDQRFFFIIIGKKGMDVHLTDFKTNDPSVGQAWWIIYCNLRKEAGCFIGSSGSRNSSRQHKLDPPDRWEQKKKRLQSHEHRVSQINWFNSYFVKLSLNILPCFWYAIIFHSALVFGRQFSENNSWENIFTVGLVEWIITVNLYFETPC